MKWIRRAIIAVLAVAVVIVGLAYRVALHAERPVGFQIVRATATGGSALPIGVWYPTQQRPWLLSQLGGVLMRVARDGAVRGRALPLVVISHGNGGSLVGHADLAMALASAGYVVAAPLHRGDNFMDQSHAGHATLFHDRVSELHTTVTALLTQWPEHARIDSTRIGAFGFSAGAVTVLAAAGAQPDLRRVAPQCARAPEFICRVFEATGSPLVRSTEVVSLPAFASDARIRAVVLAAPGLGFTMDSAALSAVSVPVQLWGSEADDAVPFATNAGPISAMLGGRAELHRVPLARHVSFLAPCGLIRPAAVCADPKGFDRRAFHAAMNAQVLAFFDARLRS